MWLGRVQGTQFDDPLRLPMQVDRQCPGILETQNTKKKGEKYSPVLHLVTPNDLELWDQGHIKLHIFEGGHPLPMGAQNQLSAIFHLHATLIHPRPLQ